MKDGELRPAINTSLAKIGAEIDGRSCDNCMPLNNVEHSLDGSIERYHVHGLRLAPARTGAGAGVKTIDVTLTALWLALVWRS